MDIQVGDSFSVSCAVLGDELKQGILLHQKVRRTFRGGQVAQMADCITITQGCGVPTVADQVCLEL